MDVRASGRRVSPTCKNFLRSQFRMVGCNRASGCAFGVRGRGGRRLPACRGLWCVGRSGPRRQPPVRTAKRAVPVTPPRPGTTWGSALGRARPNKALIKYFSSRLGLCGVRGARLVRHDSVDRLHLSAKGSNQVRNSCPPRLYKVSVLLLFQFPRRLDCLTALLSGLFVGDQVFVPSLTGREPN